MDRYVECEADKQVLVRFIQNQPVPFLVSLTKGCKRTLEQNRLQRLWCHEVAEQLGDRTSEEVRGYCKLHFGIPILREENSVFRAQYDRVVKPLNYEQKLAIMMEPLDLPVTRCMTVKQKTKYLDAVYKHWVECGVVLTTPESLE